MGMRFTAARSAAAVAVRRSSLSAAAQAQFDPRDLSGIWTITAAIAASARTSPPMTPEGEAG